MSRATTRLAQVGLALALLLALAPLAPVHADDEETTSRPLQLTRVQAQQVRAPAPPSWVYGFFRDPLWPGPGQRFVAADCPIGIGMVTIHYCPSLPPLAEVWTPPAPVWAPEVLQCDPWMQYFPVCRRPIQP